MKFLKHLTRDNTEEPIMPLVEVIRNGQITLPKALRDALGIKEGDLLEVKLGDSEMTIRPKAAIDKAMAGDKLFQMVDEIRANVKDVDPEELGPPSPRQCRPPRR